MHMYTSIDSTPLSREPGNRAIQDNASPALLLLAGGGGGFLLFDVCVGGGRRGHALKLPLLTCLSRPFLHVLLPLFLEERGHVRENEVLFQALRIQLFSSSPLACSLCYVLRTPPAFFGAGIIAQSLGGRRPAPSDKVLFMHEEADISHKNVGLHRHALHRLRMKQASS